MVQIKPSQASQVAVVIKNPTANARDADSIPGPGRSLTGGNGNSFHYSCLENSMGQRGLESYSLWGCKELDMTERLNTYLAQTFLVKQ